MIYRITFTPPASYQPQCFNGIDWQPVLFDGKPSVFSSEAAARLYMRLNIKDFRDHLTPVVKRILHKSHPDYQLSRGERRKARMIREAFERSRQLPSR